MAEDIANQLTTQVDGFSDPLAASFPNRVQIIANIADSKANSITGNYIKELSLGGLDDDSSFNLAIRDPLKKLYELGYSERMIILIDALDEALTYTGGRTIVQIISRLDDIPKQVRFIVTTGPDPRVLKHFQNVKPFDLVKHAPADVNDINLYVMERLHIYNLDDETMLRLAAKISLTANSNFLYAHLLFNDILLHLPHIPAFIEHELPHELGGLYTEFLNREIGVEAKEERWFNTFKPLLGLNAVSQGNGFTKSQLSKMLDQDVEQPLRVCKQYLEGELPVLS